MASRTPSPQSNAPATHDDVISVLGDIDESKLLAIVALPIVHVE